VKKEISRYDERGPGWYWNDFTINEHTGTHFDAPIHWVTGQDVENGSVDTIDPARFIAPVCVIDCTAEVAANPDFILSVAVLEAWEAEHGRDPSGQLGVHAQRLAQDSRPGKLHQPSTRTARTRLVRMRRPRCG